jgi:hypothetical protein
LQAIDLLEAIALKSVSHGYREPITRFGRLTILPAPHNHFGKHVKS